jgi:hypothetical protein
MSGNPSRYASSHFGGGRCAQNEYQSRTEILSVGPVLSHIDRQFLCRVFQIIGQRLGEYVCVRRRGIRPQGSVENRPCGVTSKPAIWDGPGRGPYLSCFLLIRQVCFGSPAPWSAFQDVTVMEQAVQHGGDCGAVTE